MKLFYAPINEDGSIGEYKELKGIEPIISQDTEQDTEQFWDNRPISASIPFTMTIKYPKWIRKKYHSPKRRKREYFKSVLGE